MFNQRLILLEDAHLLPRWRRPEALLLLTAIGMPLAFSVWMALLNNFAVEMVKFDGSQIGWLQTLREIPGFMAFAVVYLLLFLREQTLAMVGLLLLGGAVAITGLLPTFWGLALTTIVSSIGFHYYQTVNQSLQLQWIARDHAPKTIGKLVSAGSVASFMTFGFAYLVSGDESPPYELIYMVGGGLTIVIALMCWFAFPQFQEREPQRKKLVLRKRYWLYYVLVFMGGARRQIFVVFAGFMMVQRFGYGLHDFVGLLLISHMINTIIAPVMGRMIARFGERTLLVFEYLGLICVFTAYGIVQDPLIAAGLYITDHLFFGLAFAQKTYFQKIADPKDHASTAAAAFTINHIAAVFLPAALGYLYLISPGAVFWFGAGMAVCSFMFGWMVPRNPQPGRETVFSRIGAAQPTG